MAVVYQHIRLDTNEVFYVGIGKSEKRAFTKKGRNQHWKNIVNKYGYYVEIIYQDLTWLLACQMEKYLISEYGRYDLGEGNLVNMTDGGDGILGVIFSEETRKKMSENLKGNKRFLGQKHSEERKLKMSKVHKGNKYFLGKKHSEKTRSKMSELVKGGLNVNAKIVLDLQTGVFYDCLKDAAFVSVISYHKLKRMLNGASTNKTSMIYV